MTAEQPGVVRFSNRSTAALLKGKFHTVAVRRWAVKKPIISKRVIDNPEHTRSKSDPPEKITIRTELKEDQTKVDFHIDGVQCGSFNVNEPGNLTNDVPDDAPPDGKPFYAPRIEGTALPIVMGQGFDGALYESRLWSWCVLMPEYRSLAARASIPEGLAPPLAADYGRLVHWWRFEDGQGSTVKDSRGDTVWRIRRDSQSVAGTWVRSKDVASHMTTLFINGMPVPTVADTGAPPGDKGFSLGKDCNALLDEVRIWRGVRTAEQIRDNMFVPLRDETADLIAYYPFNSDPAGALHEESYTGADLTISGQGASDQPGLDHHSFEESPARREIGIVDTVLSPVRSDFILSADGPPCAQEYADMQISPDGTVQGAYKRAFAYLVQGNLHLVTGFKVGALTAEWISQVQYDPQLIGYIEGAPPVPGENLTLGPKTLDSDYAGISSIELVEASDIKFTYSHSKEKVAKNTAEVDGTLSNEIGLKDFVMAPFGIGMTFEAALKFSGGYTGKFESSQGRQTKDGVSNERASTKSTRFQLTGSWQSPRKGDITIDPATTQSDPATGYNKTLGLRFLPENKGLALVKSKTADVFALRLRGTLGVIAYRIVPSPDIPEDFNLITFDINPKYTKQGTLDGRIGLDGDADGNYKIFLDPDYRGAEGRGEYSYFKPKEAYRLKAQIEREEADLLAYFNTWKEATDGSSGSTAAIIGGVAGGAVGATLAVPAFGAAVEGALVGGIAGATAALQSLPFIAGPLAAAAGTTMSAVTLAKAVSQSKTYGMEPDRLKNNPAKRNLINAYVWTASGGFFELNQSQKDSLSETYTGTFSSVGMHGAASEMGFEMESPVLSFTGALKMNGLTGSSLSVERSKQIDSSQGFSMKVGLTPPTNLRHYDYEGGKDWSFSYHDADGRANLPGKVDAYRLLTFFLDGKESHYDDFFEKVVDQKWLAESGDPGAVALRPLKFRRGAKSMPWRIMHRVTFVSRILPKVKPASGGTPETINQAMSQAQIQSNYELVMALEPFLGGATGTTVDLARRLRSVLPASFPNLVPFEREVRELLTLYYGIPETTA